MSITPNTIAVAKPKANLISCINHDTPHIEEKIKYFADSINLLSKSLNTPFANKNINTKILLKIIHQLLICPNGMKKRYIEHHLSHYKGLLSPVEDYFVKNYYKDYFEKINSELYKYLTNNTYDCAPLIDSLQKLIALLDKEYLERVVDELIKVVHCDKSLEEHDHKHIIELCANIIITEYYSIGYSSVEIMQVFDNAIRYNLELIDKMYRNEIYQIPVPEELFNLKNKLSLTKYKNKVKKHLRQSNLKVQFQNILYLYNQSIHTRRFIFKIRNTQLVRDNQGEALAFECNGVKFKSSFYDSYIKKDTRKSFKEYLKQSDNYIFAEVSVFSGNQNQALEKSIRKVSEALNYLNYNLHSDSNFNNKSTKAYLDLSEYASINDFWSFLTKRYIIPIKKMSIDAMQEIKTLEDNRSNPIFANYLNLDKVFFEAVNASSNPYMISDFWRFIESLFDGYQKPEGIIDRILSYYSSKSHNHKYYGLFQQCSFYLHEYLLNERFKDLGYTSEEWWNILNDLNLKSETIEPLKEIINHPLIKSFFDKVQAIPHENIQHELNNHYYLMLRNCNIQRNLFQHSNFIIPELETIWLDEFINFMIALRTYIIKDLINNPGKTIDELIPRVEHSNRK